MRDLGYGRDYRYDHTYEDGVAPQTYLPERLGDRRFYEPSGRGWETVAARRLEEIEAARIGEGEPAGRGGELDEGRAEVQDKDR